MDRFACEQVFLFQDRNPNLANPLWNLFSEIDATGLSKRKTCDRRLYAAALQPSPTVAIRALAKGSGEYPNRDGVSPKRTTTISCEGKMPTDWPS